MSPGWRDYRRRLVQFLLVFPTSVVVMFALGSALWRFAPGEIAERIWGVLLICYAFAVLIAIVRYQAFRCPRCGRRFFMGWYRNPFATHCLHCGLPKWKEPPYEATRTI